MIFKVQALAMPLLRGLLLILVFNLLRISDAAANIALALILWEALRRQAI